MPKFPFPLPRQPRPGGYGRRQRPMFGVGQGQNTRRAGGGLKIRLLIAVGLALFALVTYFGNPGDPNQITGEVERVAMANEAEEMALGQQAAPQMIQQHNGRSRDRRKSASVDQMGKLLLRGLENWIDRRVIEIEQQTGQRIDLQNPYEFEFTLLADTQTVNAFALPGGQVFITEALYDRLGSEGQLAGVLGHEIGHVIERHGNQRMAKQKLFSGLAMAGGMAGGGDQNAMRMSQMAAQMISMKYGREDEHESDVWGVRLCVEVGYDPRAMVGLMKVLDEASPGGGPPEMMSTHPKPANRIAYIQRVIQEEFPRGLPPGLKE